MTKRICYADDCTSFVHGRGLCSKHYWRLRAHGNVGTPPRRDHEAIFERNTERRGECLEWTGTVRPDGYGVLGVNGKSTRAHRFAFERVHGEIPDDRVIDHACHNRACVEVSHLRLATPTQNAQNRSGRRPGRLHDLPRNVYRHTATGTYQVFAEGVYGGRFDDVEPAAERAEAMRAGMYGEFAGAA